MNSKFEEKVRKCIEEFLDAKNISQTPEIVFQNSGTSTSILVWGFEIFRGKHPSISEVLKGDQNILFSWFEKFCRPNLKTLVGGRKYKRAIFSSPVRFAKEGAIFCFRVDGKVVTSLFPFKGEPIISGLEK